MRGEWGVGDPTALSELIPISTATQTLSFSPEGHLRPEFPGQAFQVKASGQRGSDSFSSVGQQDTPRESRRPPPPVWVGYFGTVAGRPQTVSMRSLLVRHPQRGWPTSAGKKHIGRKALRRRKRSPREPMSPQSSHATSHSAHSVLANEETV